MNTTAHVIMATHTGRTLGLPGRQLGWPGVRGAHPHRVSSLRPNPWRGNTRHQVHRARHPKTSPRIAVKSTSIPFCFRLTVRRRPCWRTTRSADSCSCRVLGLTPKRPSRSPTASAGSFSSRVPGRNPKRPQRCPAPTIDSLRRSHGVTTETAMPGPKFPTRTTKHQEGDRT